MTTIPLLPVYDRSRTVTDWKCPRARYWGYEFRLKGITKETHLELFLGTATHEGLASIAQGLPIDEVARAAQQQVYTSLLAEPGDGISEADAIEWAMEQSTLVEGMLRGFYKHAWPRLIAGAQVVLVEPELLYEHDGLLFMAKPDLVIRDAEGNLFYIEFKTTANKKDGWVNSWNTAVQLHSTIRAIERQLGEPVSGVIVQGLYKGYESYGKQNSPFCYAYQRKGQPPFSEDQTTYEYKAGFKRSPTWELPGGVVKWIENMPEHILTDQFPQSPVIYLNDALLESFFRQRAFREKEIRRGMDFVMKAEVAGSQDLIEQTLDEFFPQHFDQCVPGWGKPCQFRQLCHGGGADDPLSHGYIWRTPHHTPEAERFKESEPDAQP